MQQNEHEPDDKRLEQELNAIYEHSEALLQEEPELNRNGKTMSQINQEDTKAETKTSAPQSGRKAGKTKESKVPQMPLVENESKADETVVDSTVDVNAESTQPAPAEDAAKAAAEAAPQSEPAPVAAPEPEPVKETPEPEAPKPAPVEEVTAAPLLSPTEAALTASVRSMRTMTGFLIFLMLVLFAAAGFGVWYFTQHPPVAAQQPVDTTPQENKQAIGFNKENLERLEKKFEEFRTETRETYTPKATTEELVKQYGATVEKQNENISSITEIASRLKTYEARDPDDWRIAQAYFMVSNATQMALFSHDVKAALWCLKNADTLLVNLEDARLTEIRRAIAADVLALESVSPVDSRGISFRLDSVYDTLPKLGLNQLSDPEVRAAKLKQRQEEAASLGNWQENLWESFKTFTSRFIEIRHREGDAVNEFLSPEQGSVLRQNVQSEILLAKFALYHGNQEAFTANVETAAKLITDYYDHDSQSYEAVIGALNELKGMTVVPNLPSEVASFGLFNAYAVERLNLKDAANRVAAEETAAAEATAAPAEESAPAEAAPAAEEAPAAETPPAEEAAPASPAKSGGKSK